MKLQFLDTNLCIFRLDPSENIPEEVWDSSFLSVTRTEEETSIVCEDSFCPKSGKIESGYGLIKIIGPLDFGQTGVLNTFLEPLAKAKISVFSVSTYDTDYILVKSDDLAKVGEIFEGLPDVEII